MLTFILCGFWLNFAHSDTHEGAPVYLEIGEQRMLSFEEMEKYSVSGDVVHYVRLPGKNVLLVKALKPGTATLYVSTHATENETHLIKVELRKNSPYPGGLLQALHSIHSTEVIDQGNHYVFRGEVRDAKEAWAINDLKSKFSSFILDETSIESTWLIQNKKAIETLLASYPELKLTAERGELLVQGGLANASIKEALIKKIKAIQPLTDIEISTITTGDPTLYFKVFLLEVKKEWMNHLGIEWSGEHPASLGLTTSQFLLSDSIDLTIHALTEQGLARVLSSPELVVKAPGQAELFAGGELPIRARTKFSDSIVWKNVGLSLKLDVKEYGGEKVRLLIETEMSCLDQAMSLDKIPGIKTNRMKTLVDGTLGKPLLLSGLLQEDMHDTSKGLPILSDIPILGKLFSSEDYQNKRSEFVAILLPHRNLPQHPMERVSRETPRGYLPLPRNYMSGNEIDDAKKEKGYPWNVL